jgi:hypothetical protein
LLKKQVGQANKAATDADGFVKNCLQTAAPVGLFGDVPDLAIGATQTYGFHYVASAGGAEGYSAAFSLDTSASPQAYFLEVDPTCVNQSAAAHAASQLMFRAKRTP